MSSATRNARCWWCGTDGAIATRDCNAARSIDRAGFLSRYGSRPCSRYRSRQTSGLAKPKTASSIWLRVSPMSRSSRSFICRSVLIAARRCRWSTSTCAQVPNQVPKRRKNPPELRDIAGRAAAWDIVDIVLLQLISLRQCAAAGANAANQRRHLRSDCLHSPQCNLRLDRFKMIRYHLRCN
jgi:hypothetical protein